MIEIKDLLLRFNNLLLQEDIKRSLLKKTLKETVGLEIDLKDIKIKKNTVYLNIKAIYKNEILLKKEKILSKLKEELGNKSPSEIR